MQYIKLPLILFTSDRYKSLSVHAKVIFAFMLDRLSLSDKNSLKDKNGNVYIIFSHEALAKAINLKLRSVYNYVRELKNAGLIRSAHQSIGKPDLLYINTTADFAVHDCKIYRQRTAESACYGLQNLQTNHTNINHTDINQFPVEEVEQFWLNKLEEYAKEIRSEST